MTEEARRPDQIEEQQAPLGAAGEPAKGVQHAPQAIPEEPRETGTLEDPDTLTTLHAQGLRVEARSLWRLTLQRFLRHKLAMTSLVILIVVFSAGFLAPQLAPYSFDQIDLPNGSLGPTVEAQHYFGTDQLGRDYFSRVLYGIRVTARVALTVALLSTLFGALYGAISGYFGGAVDNVMMRLVDLMLTLPSLAILLAASALIAADSPGVVAVLLALFYWPILARVVRGTFLSLKEKEFIEAAKALGASDRRIILRHMLPNSMGPIIVNATLTIAIAILVEATLSFLGFGIQPPTPSLGSLIEEGKGQMLSLWWLVTFPGLTIVLICLCINFLGDGLRDALDPTQRKTS